MSNENSTNATSQRNGRHCTREQYEIMLRIIEVPENFDCLCGIHKSSVPKNDSRKTRKIAIYKLMAEKVGAGWTANSAKSRFETWFHNFKKVFNLCGDDGLGATGWGITDNDRKKGIHTIVAKKESMCYGYERLKALYQHRENVNPSYHEECGIIRRSTRYASALAPASTRHEPPTTDPADDDQHPNESGRSGDDSNDQHMTNIESNYESFTAGNVGPESGGSVGGGNNERAGSPVIQPSEQEQEDVLLGDGNNEDDESPVRAERHLDQFGDEEEEGGEDEEDEEGDEEDEEDVGSMPKRHGNFTAAYDAQGVKRLKVEYDLLQFKKKKHEEKMRLEREKLELERIKFLKEADDREMVTKLQFIQSLLERGSSPDEAEALYKRFTL